MARTIRNVKLDTRSARTKLAQRREPYWTMLVKGLALGYRRTATGSGTWIARWRDEAGKQHYQALGTADDALDADGERVLTFGQAQEKTRAWFAILLKGGQDQPERPTVVTVADAAVLYLTWYERHRKAFEETRRVVERYILPNLGGCPAANLTATAIRDWHEALASAPRGDRRGVKFPLPLEGRTDKTDTSSKATRARKATANRVLTVLKAILNHAFNEGHLHSDVAWRRAKPFQGVTAATL